MGGGIGRLFQIALLLLATFSTQAIGQAAAAEVVRVGVLKFGTVSWELDTIKRHKLDEKHGITVDVQEFAGEDATNVALMAGAVDVIVSDWLWVSRQRATGIDLTFVPYSTAVGAVMVPPDSPIKNLGDLTDKKIGVAGGPLDKNWLLIQAMAKKDYSRDLAKTNTIVYGAPPLLTEKVQQRELDAVLNFWNYCARLEAKGFRRLTGGQEAAAALGASGPIVALGYIFHEAWGKAHPSAIDGFVAASADAKALLESSDDEWKMLAQMLRGDESEQKVMRDRYREGIPKRPPAEAEKDAETLYSVLATIGGEELVGPSKELMPGTFWGAD
ncbi:NitT/TauT family transport system substrate-binding protein [Rhizobium petrolearium]|uniref:ABC transporter substrate-binding protein n=1 Tax=Neorhizobium petrolearium TaxID=515361 RepID=UPI001AE396C4|nr:ABC transporter substrate-binding protein [Neorhizobium petrolearium]MBP1842913.1 NitT/TauT family transport system substrate-binding protein [Neorhizobium petrolearium]